MVKKMKRIRTENEFKKWFEKNYKKLGYSKIIKKDNGKFPDFIMLRKGKEIKVELETLASNFILHKHNPEKVDEIICIKKDIDIGVLTREINGLNYVSKIKRVSFTVDEKTVNMINILLKKKGFRNKSHVIEEAIRFLAKKEKENGKK